MALFWQVSLTSFPKVKDAGKVQKLDLLLAKISIEEKSVGERGDRRSSEYRNNKSKRQTSFGLELPLVASPNNTTENQNSTTESESGGPMNLTEIFAAVDEVEIEKVATEEVAKEEVTMENPKASKT